MRVITLAELVDLDHFNTLPKKSGVYFLYDESMKLKYIGKAVDIRGRVKGHLEVSKGIMPTDEINLMNRNCKSDYAIASLWKINIKFIRYILCENKEEIERKLIRKLKPDLNIKHNPKPNYKEIEQNQRLFDANNNGFDDVEEFEKVRDEEENREILMLEANARKIVDEI